VAVDDWVPGVGNGPWYSQLEEGDDAWPLILEKAYAKIFGSYSIINGGNVKFFYFFYFYLKYFISTAMFGLKSHQHQHFPLVIALQMRVLCSK